MSSIPTSGSAVNRLRQGSISTVCLALTLSFGCGSTQKPNAMKKVSGQPFSSAAGEEASLGSQPESQTQGSTVSTTTGTQAAGTQATGAQATPKEAGKPGGKTSPWGTPDSDSGRPLPARRAMSRDAQSAYKRGVAASRSGDDRGAIAAFNEALKKDSKAYKAAYALGVIADRQGNEKKAMSFYRKALKIQPDYEMAVQGIVNIHLRNGSTSAAISEAESAARKWERNLYLQAIYADVLAKSNRVEESEQAARSALRRDERFIPAMVSLIKSSLIRGRKELAESILEQAMSIDQKNAELHFIKGKMEQEKERLAEAMKSFQKAVQLRPDFTEARIALGIQYLASGNYQQALEQFQVSARLAPRLVAVHLNLGDAYRANKMWKNAKAEFDKALRMKNDLPEAHFNLGLMYMSAGADYPGLDSIEAYTRAISEFNNYRQLMGSRLKRGDLSESYISDLQRSIDREKKRIEREKARAEREKERAARTAEEGGDEAGNKKETK